MPDSGSHILYRSDTNRVLGGVAGGLGEYFAVDPVIFRLGFLVLTLIGGGGIILYLLCWLLIPSRHTPPGTAEERVRHNAEHVAREWEAQWSRTGRRYGGVWLIVLGIIFLFANLGFPFHFLFGHFWPIILIVVGIYLLSRRRY